MFSKGKFRSLDAICAKLKSETQKDSDTSNGLFNGGQGKDLETENNNGFDRKILDKCIPLDRGVRDECVHYNGNEKLNRRKRKATTPRNILDVREHFDKIDEKDELAEYEVNNQNTNFPPDEDDELNHSNNSSESGKENHISPSISNSTEVEKKCDTPELSSLKDSPVTNSIQNSLVIIDKKHFRKPRKSTPNYTGYGSPLDLSTSNSFTSNQTSIIDEEVAPNKEDDEPQKQTTQTKEPDKSKDKHANQEISSLMDYAEHTMNELLSIYGLNGTADSVTRQVPNKCFSSNQILRGRTGVVPGKESLPTSVIVSNTSGQLTSTGPIYGQKKGINVNYLSSNKSKAPNTDAIKDDKFTNSAAYIKAVFNQSGEATPTKTAGLPDYSKYLKRFANGVDCKVKYCKELGYREHFHCMDCNFRVFVKKEEMVRHFKWHRKREESLQHGFMRYSPMDDCSTKFGNCTHNGRQTHYHCLQGGCDKVYISTSDVQMHANYHRKDSAIIQEGFQRFRATEDCGTQSCAFYGQRTTHFHCRRPGCNFTFKNKADMEKHKTYHQKDEVLARDGFKKFMKYEHCGYLGCRYSKLSNHIHCIRPGCLYVLHSTAQLFSHKRKHERRDFESAYKKFKEESQEAWAPSQIPGVNLVHSGMQITPKPNKDGMSLPVSIKSEPMNDGESADSKFQSEVAYDDNSNSDMKSVVSETSDSMLVDGDSSSCNADTGLKDGSLLSEHVEELDGEKLNDSLTLPIPLYGDGGKKEEEPSSLEPTGSHSVELTEDVDLSTPKHVQKPISVITGVKTAETVNSVETTPEVSAVVAQTSPSPGYLQSPSSGTMLPILARPPPINLEKRERDESWKNYLIRFTANDPCNSRCQYLYKDHYHCRVEGCLVLFKSKDGVREHARFHELQDRITPVAYTTYDAEYSCPQDCQYSNKEKHYHCIWSGCTHVVPHHGPTFGRLEHYRIHEDARASIGKTYKYAVKSTDETPRRRGRPPKYPKNVIPVIPKVELSDREIEDSIEGTLDASVVNGFKKFEDNEPCPDELCIYQMKQHYHCARPRCHQATDRLDVLNLHAKDFHSFVTILEGFEFFDRNINCRRVHCHNNKANRHFHCVRPKCDYSFVRHSTMLQHNKRHSANEVVATTLPPTSGLVSNIQEAVVTSSFIPIIPALPLSATDAKGMIKTSGIYYPLSGLSPQQKGQSSIVTSMAEIGIPSAQLTSPLMSSHIFANPVVGSPVLSSLSPVVSSPGQLPLTVLLQQGCKTLPQPNWPDMRSKMHYIQNEHCGRPFCKLKKKDHYHCFECNQAFSDESRIRSHIGKHGIKFSKYEVSNLNLPLPMMYNPSAQAVAIASKQESVHSSTPLKEKVPSSPLEAQNDDTSKEADELNASDSLNLNPSTFSNMIAKAQMAHAGQDEEKEPDREELLDGKLVIEDVDNYESENNTDSLDSLGGKGVTMDLSKRSGRKRTRTKHDGFVNSDSIVIKQRRTSAGSVITNPKSPKSKSSNKDDTVPDGYIKIRHKDQCTYAKCAYHQGVTHFHCSREDCGYSFSDRSRLIQHTLRHERIDSLTGGEMQQYRMKQDCERLNCEYKGKASHFHCLKCNYCCTDSSKVLTHRKYHSKLENINSQGFEKYGVSEKCDIRGCQYELKQTHYHCTKPSCQYAVLGPAQMASHNIKHANDSL